MTVKGCGVDLIEITRIKKALSKERFKQKIYTEFEREYLSGRSAQSWAARFAAKEAVMKSLGRGWLQGVPFNSIEIYNNQWGQPQIRLKSPALEVAQDLGIKGFVLSLSHTKELAIAYVIALGEE
ncbi:MAG: holo-ACP synthase [Bacillota bacterium]|nr:holo-ACP synthase [Bacillota bacterium]HHU61037.1 holo-ACP synthase [Natronincola sp.]